MLLAIAVLFVGGCAKQNLVKKDETVSLAETAKPSEAPTEKTEPKVSDIKEEPVKSREKRGISNVNSDTPDEFALDKIFFDLDSYTLSPNARDTLAKNAKKLEKRVGVKVQIEGHCDERGSGEYNLALGEKRARSAMQYLLTLGIPEQSLATISYGKEKPADPGHDESAWSRNRRVEFILSRQ